MNTKIKPNTQQLANLDQLEADYIEAKANYLAATILYRQTVDDYIAMRDRQELAFIDMNTAFNEMQVVYQQAKLYYAHVIL
jgi:hypothetical protein